MASIEIDGRSYPVRPGENLLKTCLESGLDLPYFCWHPALGSVGACRQCAVIQYQNAEDSRGRIVMACMTPVADGMRISLESPLARDFRANIIELLMTNHPHDCPVCEEGGECHLQDMTEMTGHTFRQYRGRKRTHRNQNLGSFINHEMNRCIACYRCIRYYQDYCGGHDLQVFAAHNHVYFGRHEDGALESEFSGNLVEVCPTGVFTDKTFSRHYTRKWDLQSAPSVCPHCALGCNTSPGERYGTLRRIANRYHGEINGYFLCDRGRFGYEFVNSERRIRQSFLRQEGRSELATPAGTFEGLSGASNVSEGVANPVTLRMKELSNHFADLVRQSSGVIGIGSPRASLEANFALRELVGPENFHLGFSDGEHAMIGPIVQLLQHGPVRVASLREVEQTDAVFVLGEDVSNTAPRLALSLRQAVRNEAFAIADRLKIPRWQDSAVRNAAQSQTSPLFVASFAPTRLDDVASCLYRGSPEDLARLGFAVARCLNPAASEVTELDSDREDLAIVIAEALKHADRPLIVAGTGCQNELMILAAASIAAGLSAGREDKPTAVHFVVPECNSLGLAMIGGRTLAEAFAAIEQGRAETVVVLENDLYRRASRPVVDGFLAKSKHVVVIDHLFHETAQRAELVLAATTFAESEGTWVSSEGRAQRFFAVCPPTAEIRDSWSWLGEAGGKSWGGIEEVTRDCAEALTVFQAIPQAASDAGLRFKGRRIPRQPHRYSGRTALLANVLIHEPKPPGDAKSLLTFSMEGEQSYCTPALNPFTWAPGWNSNQSVNKFQEEIGGHLRGGDPGVRIVDTVEKRNPTQEPGCRAPFRAPRRTEHRPATEEGSGVTHGAGNALEALPEGEVLNSTTLPQGEGLEDAAHTSGSCSFRLVPLYHVFGSEELSMWSRALAERAPTPYLALHPEEAEMLGLKPGDEVQLSLSGVKRRLPVLPLPGLARGLAGIPWGLPGLAWVECEQAYWEHEG